MKMIDLTEYKVIDVEEFEEIVIPLSLRREMELTLSEFDKVFNEQLEKAFDEIDLAAIDKPVYFILHTDLGKDDRELMGDFILTRFAPYIIAESIPEDRERRWGVPVGLEKVHIQYATMLDFVNKYEYVKQLNIGIATRSGKNVIDLVS